MGGDKPRPSRMASPTHAEVPLVSTTDIPRGLWQVTRSLQLLVLCGDSRAVVWGQERLKGLSREHGGQGAA